MDDERPNPEDLLEAIRKEESKTRKGRLKIFLGMSAGVGKTYAMLEAAQRAKKEGVHLLIASIDAHGREETKRLFEDLPTVPEKWIHYRDTVFEELDLDEILRLRPNLVIVDELAHSNVPGSRHPKRWQDVVEILEHGMDVYTTLNIQHIESLKEIVESIANITVRETVPDSLVESATSIEVIDITPEELLQRLKEGKVYFPEQSEIAARHFFQEDRLTALREIVLRYAAKKIDHDLRSMVSTVERPVGWKLKERLLVAISSNPDSQKLIRTTRRLAFNLDAPWFAVYVNNGSHLNEQESSMLSKNLALARDLGAEVIMTNDLNIAAAIERIARQKGVTQIIVGRSAKRRFFGFFRNIALISKLIKFTSDIDIHFVRQSQHRRVFLRKMNLRFIPKDFLPYLVVVLFVGIITALNWWIEPSVGYQVAGFIFLASTLVLSQFYTKGPILVAIALFALIWDYFFIPEIGSLLYNSARDNLILFLYVVTAVVTCILTDRARQHKEMLIKREESLRAIYEIVRDIASAPNQQQLLQSVERRLGSILNGICEIVLKTSHEALLLDKTHWENDEKVKNAALWVFHNGQEAGWSTSTLASIPVLVIPLKGFAETVGVLMYKPNQPGKFLTLDEKNFAFNAVHQLAVYFEKVLQREREREAERISQIEKTHQAILRLLSEEFQKPLVNIQETIKEILPIERTVEVQKVESSSEKLGQILTNISVLARMNSGLIPVRKELHNLRGLIDSCLEKLRENIDIERVKVSIPSKMPEVLFDYSLMELLLFNILFNAAKSSPPGTPIEVEARLKEKHVVITIKDKGKGPEGIGLALAKSIIEVHEGSIMVEQRPEGWSVISLYLPL